MTPVAFGQPVEATHSLRLRLGGVLELGVLLCAWGLNPHPASSGCHEVALCNWYLHRALLGGVLLRYLNAFNIDVFLFPLISPTAAGIKITSCTSSRPKQMLWWHPLLLVQSLLSLNYIILLQQSKEIPSQIAFGGRERRVMFTVFFLFFPNGTSSSQIKARSLITSLLFSSSLYYCGGDLVVIILHYFSILDYS